MKIKLSRGHLALMIAVSAWGGDRAELGISPDALARAKAGGSDYEWKPIEKSASFVGVNVTGRVVPQDGALHIESARVQGRVLAILKREGEAISIGTRLYSIISAECFSLLEEKRVATSKHLAELVEGVEKREKQLGLTLDADQCFITAGHAGFLTKRNMESGSSFNAGDALATTLDTKRLTIELDVPERDQSRVRSGQKVTFQFASHPGQTFSTRVQNVVPTIDPLTRTSKVRLLAMKLPNGVSLDALVFGEVDTGQHEPILKVASSALVFSRSQQFVVTGGDAKPVAVAVQVVSESDSQSAVRPLKDGALKEGELVATKGAIFLFRKLSSELIP